MGCWALTEFTEFEMEQTNSSLAKEMAQHLSIYKCFLKSYLFAQLKGTGTQRVTSPGIPGACCHQPMPNQQPAL